MRDVMRFYTGLVERCFNDCVNDFTSKVLSSKEVRKMSMMQKEIMLDTETCVLRCTEKFIKYNERVGQRWAEMNQQLAQAQNLQGTPFPK
ncbi:8315_t:CDS:2 [Paraglomus brasilianum]|uniref:Mitochondrial import inner membrane translocase subunit n=1 Tax=Paraglomus brasilianum TaxID=144538 RepID=A0A9N8YXV6_9GLOM|nr:8315_t:CDS:2 [Paraglomus brasilianum]